MTELERLIIAAQEAEKLRKLVAVEILILEQKIRLRGQHYTPWPRLGIDKVRAYG